MPVGHGHNSAKENKKATDQGPKGKAGDVGVGKEEKHNDRRGQTPLPETGLVRVGGAPQASGNKRHADNNHADDPGHQRDRRPEEGQEGLGQRATRLFPDALPGRQTQGPIHKLP